MRIRVRQISELIDASDRSVVDYGAGEMFLKTLLSPELEYYPVDYIWRSNETILCDLNSGVFPVIYADVAILAGVLEFLLTAESLIHHVCSNIKHKIILTYITVDKFSDIEGRRASAYVNHFSEQQIIDLFTQENFSLKEMTEDPAHSINTLFLFEKLK